MPTAHQHAPTTLLVPAAAPAASPTPIVVYTADAHDRFWELAPPITRDARTYVRVHACPTTTRLPPPDLCAIQGRAESVREARQWAKLSWLASTVTAAGWDRGKNLSGFREVSLRDGCPAQDTP